MTVPSDAWKVASGADRWWLDHANSFEFRVVFDECRSNDIVFEVASRGEGRWAVVWGGLVLDEKSNTFVHEPMNSYRTEAFFKRCRFDSKESALKVLQKFVATWEIGPGGLMKPKPQPRRRKNAPEGVK